MNLHLFTLLSLRGRQTADWVLMDYVDFVVHVFREDRREFYRLERLWGDARTVDLPAEPGPAEDAASSLS